MNQKSIATLILIVWISEFYIIPPKVIYTYVVEPQLSGLIGYENIMD